MKHLRKIFSRTVLTFVVSLQVFSVSAPTVSALVPAQRQIFDSGSRFFELNSVTIAGCNATETSGPTSGVTGDLSASQVPEPQRSALIKAAEKYKISPGALAGLFISEQNGFQLYYQYFDAGKSISVITGLKPDSSYWKNDMFSAAKKGLWPNQGKYNGAFQFGAPEWNEYGEDGDGDGQKNVLNFYDQVYGAAHYLAVLGGTLDKGVEGVRKAAKSYNGQGNFYGGIKNPGGQFAQIQDLYAEQVVLISQGLSSGTPGATTPATGATNTDYAGRPVFNEAQLAAIAQNQTTYQHAATQVDIPWQMLAVVHLRESGLKLSNPGNGQGLYQFLNKNGGPYPTGPVSQTEFARQTVLAAQFLKNTADGNYAPNQTLTAASPADTIKDTFFSYNGRAGVYADQAASLGYSKDTQGFEGSPYVMNIADAKRDPKTAAPKTWGQIKRDHGPIEYPANSDYGAFVFYAALAGGVASTGQCVQQVTDGGGTVSCDNPSNATQGLSIARQNAVCIAQKELADWTAGILKPGMSTGYGKYSQLRSENWCADFVSWVYNEAGYPLRVPPGSWNVPAVDNVRSIGMAGGRWQWHPARSGYTPRPGDLVVHKEGNSHVNMVVGVSGTRMQIIGGNQVSYNFNQSRVSTYTVNGFSGVDRITGYVSPD